MTTCRACGVAGETRFYRKPWATGGGFHVVEICTACGGRAAGSNSVYVPFPQVRAAGYDPDTLPLLTTAPVGGLVQGVLL